MHTVPLYESTLESIPLISRGKVRDIYSLGENLLIVSTDRISAFDVVFKEVIPDKGYVLTQLTNFWLNYFSEIPNHSTSINVNELNVLTKKENNQVRGRASVVKNLKPILVEAVARGYLIGSAWNEYEQCGSVSGINLPNNLKLASQLNTPIFTPASKAPSGQHDENIHFDEFVKLVGEKAAEQIRDTTINIYLRASKYALGKGIIIADTKLEFGIDEDGSIKLMDEVITPDSSRFWCKESYKEGTSPVSFDKQFIRDWLESISWDKCIPAPSLPGDIIKRTAEKYLESLEKLTGRLVR